MHPSPPPSQRHTGLFVDLSEYVHSNVYVPDLASVPAYLGLRHVAGGLWDTFTEWTPCREVRRHGRGRISD
jgi:hypothetical protein